MIVFLKLTLQPPVGFLTSPVSLVHSVHTFLFPSCKLPAHPVGTGIQLSAGTLVLVS